MVSGPLPMCVTSTFLGGQHLRSQPHLEEVVVLLIGAGQKMYLGRDEARAWFEHVATHLPPLQHVSTFVLPSFVWLGDAQNELQASPVKWGSQNVHWEDAGAWTGEVSPTQLKQLGVTYVEIGHSERREHFNETNEAVNMKVRTALRHGLIPIVCIGEAERDSALAESVLAEQLTWLFAQVPHDAWPNVVVAYEPVWAIGQKEPADLPYLAQRFQQLRSWVIEHNPSSGQRVPLLYGGSVSEHTAEQLLSLPEIGGLFIGRGALDPDAFCRIAALADTLVKEG